MPLVPEDILQRIRDATDIVDLVSEHVQLVKKGRNYSGLCPFHDEKTPSFSVDPDRQFYHCFGCGVGGNAFKFIQEIDRVTFVEAVKFLAERAGVALPERSGPSREEDVAADELYRANDLAQKYFHYLLLNDNVGASARTYLQTRGLTGETIERFGLGYAPPEWDALLKVAGRRGLNPHILERAGLALPRSTGSGHYDRFRDRITFPIANISNRTIAFGARALQPDQEPKYLNSPETPIYHKGRVLYGLSDTKDAIRSQGTVLVVEGYMDLISLAQAGIQHVVATCGTALTEDHCRLLDPYAQELVLLFDNDTAGFRAGRRGLAELLGTTLAGLASLKKGSGLKLVVVSLPPGHDPDSFVQKHGPDALINQAKKAQPLLNFYLDQLAQQHDLSSIEGRIRAVETFKSLIIDKLALKGSHLEKNRDKVVRDELLKKVAPYLGVDEQALRHELEASVNRRPASRKAPAEPSPTAVPDPPRHELEFVGLLFNFPQFIPATAQELALDALADARTQALCRTLFDRHAQGKAIDLGMIISGLEDDALARLAAQCAAQGFDEEQVERQWRDSLLYFQKSALQKRIANARQALAAASDDSEIARISAELVALNKERQAVAAQQSS